MNIIKKIFTEYLPLTLSIIIFLLIVLNFNTCNNLKDEKNLRDLENKIHLNNLLTQQDSLKQYYDSINNIYVSEKMSYIVNQVEDLKNYDNKLYKMSSV